MEWPGNVRELENVVERAVLLTRGNVLQLSLPDIAPLMPSTPPVATEVAQDGEDEYQLIMRVLKETNGVVAGPKARHNGWAETYNVTLTHEAIGY